MDGKNRFCLKGFCAVIVVLCAAVLTAQAFGAQKGISDKGAGMMTLRGGAPGDVPFPHGLHQESLGDCNVCHDSYPQKKDAILAKQKAGDLKKQEVMNSQCIKCHMENQSESAASGPIECQKCHRR